MRRLADLYEALDQTTSTNAKVDALVRYFKEAPPEDAAWALYFLTGQKLKRLLNPQVVRSIAKDLRNAYPSFGDGRFVKACLAGLEELELMQRARHIADAMYLCLPRPFAAAAAVLIDSLGPELTRADQFGLAPLRYMPHVFFVQKYGLEDFETSMFAQYELTKRFSAESSIRARPSSPPTDSTRCRRARHPVPVRASTCAASSDIRRRAAA